ncbi:type IV pilin N-terminal domain-containing protein [Methanococcoides sp.]|uniref:type IV pilin N-terminal domain-containing protein n=1 Tax=Methanococcoides sp. TaxID=1966350 RepID=UPI00272E7224|nr:type IV pilin N-terminal domain-containing protein [Methanococcoides sp.]
MASEMIGEMLKLSIAVMLVAVLSMSVYALLPDERVPYVEIELVVNETNSSIIDITHVGGDPLKASEVKIVVKNETGYQDEHLLPDQVWRFPQTIHLTTNLMNVSEVSVIHLRAVLAIAEVEQT